ncbi:MAG TPA: nitroreductase family deazaflavin-dependent oxidoreductase [Candidatus Dormibacteraeota bacterium]|jgi:deazaflavin-dependent oxidoreductase (nitroreductase family)
MPATQDQIQQALQKGGVVDITTTGRQSGEPRRIEIVFHNLGGRVYISGTPSPKKRKWLANLEANSNFTFHLKGAVMADLPARARVIDDEAERREVLPHIARNWNRTDIDTMVLQSPLIEVELDRP